TAGRFSASSRATIRPAAFRAHVDRLSSVDNALDEIRPGTFSPPRVLGHLRVMRGWQARRIERPGAEAQVATEEAHVLAKLELLAQARRFMTRQARVFAASTLMVLTSLMPIAAVDVARAADSLQDLGALSGGSSAFPGGLNASGQATGG